MLQTECPQKNHHPSRIAPRNPGNRAADAVADIAVDADVVVLRHPRHPFQLRSNRRKLNHWRRKPHNLPGRPNSRHDPHRRGRNFNPQFPRRAPPGRTVQPSARR
jgi:hypothetical protein